ncbi:MAG: two-component regulator propeller domain-containing protein [Dyadobacter sp.]|uniref:hybrid sensor histidine kinase/response regulator transcription factor n=1 Tax=Dyadobacter sp. TaxID=1914288 RepID=UPI003264F141
MKPEGLAFVIALLFWYGITAQAQPYTASVKHYGPEQGLSHREVNAIFQDRQGFLWFGTKFGLNRFDGKTFTVFTNESHGLGFDDIESITQDAEGNLWLRGPNGSRGNDGQSPLNIFNPLSGKAVSFDKKFAKKLPSPGLNALSGLLSSPDGTIFLTNYQPASLISWRASGLQVVSLPKFKTLGLSRPTDRNTVWAVADESQIVELNTDGKVLHQFSHPGTVMSWCFGQRNAGIEFFYFVYDASRREHHLYSVDTSGHRQEHSPALLREKSLVQYLAPVCYPLDRTGLRWDGFNLRDSTNRILLSVADKTSGETIENRSFYRDPQGQFWLGTSFGVYQVQLTRNHFRRLAYRKKNQQAQTPVRGITVRSDIVYANLEKSGLYEIPWQGGEPRKLISKGAFAYGLAQDSTGELYTGNAGGGEYLARYNPSSATHSEIPLPIDTEIWTLHPVGAGQWLAGSQKGLLWVDQKKGSTKPFTDYHQFTELSQAHCLYIAPDRQGLFWICANTGIYAFSRDRGVIARYWSGGKGQFRLPADSYQHFYQDKAGIFWLATAHSGLIRWDRQHNTYRQFRRSEGLSNDNIYAIYPDRRGNLWMSSDYGVMQFDPVKSTARTYFVQDGITHNEFNRISHHQDRAGRIYFGGLNGITAFDPRSFENEQPSPPQPIRLVSARRFDPSLNQLVDQTRVVSDGNEIIIRPGEQPPVLDFALLNFTDAEKNVYAYQFKGLDNEWRHQSESTLRLGNLPYGNYDLLIKGQASNGQWSANTLTVRVTVLRPFYLQTWFAVLSVLLLIGSIWLWTRLRTWNHRQEQQRMQTEIRRATTLLEQDKELIGQQAHQLLQLNETRSRFFANISHEFRSPLTVILGMASELQRQNPEDNVPRRMATMIERSGSQLLRLINQILDLSKIEAGETQWQPTRSDLVRFTRYIAETFSSLATQKQIQLLYPDSEEPLVADFDRHKLQDILTNLVSNALKFTPAGGQVWIELTTRETWPPLEDEGYHEEVIPTKNLHNPWIMITVRDTGTGIETQLLPLIFNRFFQVGTQSVADTGGTGIGLSLVRELTLLMNGALAVRSWPGQGSAFVVGFERTCQAPPPTTEMAIQPFLVLDPLASEQVTGGEPTADVTPGKPVLLLVEDNEDVAAYITTCVQADYQIIRANNGQVGIDLAREHVPDLVLSDVMMPLKDGFQLCDEVKNDQRTSHIPVVLLTARSAGSDRIHGLQRGADAYLTKPFQRDELLVVLDNLLQSRRRLQAHYSRQVTQSTDAGIPPVEENESLENLFLQQLRSALRAQWGNNPIPMETIYHEMGMSRSSLHRKLIALTGMSVTRYDRSLRLTQSRHLLATTQMPISEVAYAVGFEDPKYFTRLFSEEYASSPTEFRRLSI